MFLSKFTLSRMAGTFTIEDVQSIPLMVTGGEAQYQGAR
jgi:hypothetical protein